MNSLDPALRKKNTYGCGEKNTLFSGKHFIMGQMKKSVPDYTWLMSWHIKTSPIYILHHYYFIFTKTRNIILKVESPKTWIKKSLKRRLNLTLSIMKIQRTCNFKYYHCNLLKHYVRF